jgi:hypothetical protein
MAQDIWHREIGRGDLHRPLGVSRDPDEDWALDILDNVDESYRIESSDGDRLVNICTSDTNPAIEWGNS